MTTPPQGNPYMSPPPHPNPAPAGAAPPQAAAPNPYAQPSPPQPGHPQPPVPPQTPSGYPNPQLGYPHPQSGYPQTPPGPPQTPPGYPHPAHMPYPHPPALGCRFCGGSPAAQVTFRAHRGLIVLMSFRKVEGMMCGTCGLAVYRALMTETLWQGWWSPFSAVLFTPFTVLYNLLAARKVRKLGAPAPGTHGRQIDPGVPVYRRPLAYVAFVPVLWVLYLYLSAH
ncbi:hypothetical protein [Streptomyces sp. bgisy153]|uniref:hypothetical protein n=1 Tax=Streptomyces sp. bgisy153 TaxID=3413793 RepID=UPI003D754AB2